MLPDMLDIGGLRRLTRSGAVTPADIAAEALKRIAAAADPAVWISRVPSDDVMARATALAQIPDGAELLPLYGIPFAVKDNIDAAGLPTTAACPAFAYRPERNAAAVARLLEAGAVLMGKTNLDQFATGLVGTRSPYGAPRSVFHADYISGGSSSGSAVAVAAGLVSFALGTDTAGSGRVPAAFNNIVGVKPTRGRISTGGVVPACRTLDCVSVLALGAGDASAVAEIAAAYDPEDPFSRVGDLKSLPLAQFRFGVLVEEDREFFGDPDAASLYDAAIRRLEALGGTATRIRFAPFRDAASLLYEGPWLAERFAAVGPFLTRSPEAFDPVVAGIIAKGAEPTAAQAFKGFYRLAELLREAETEWSRADVLLLPTAPTTYRVADVEADPVRTNARLGTYTNFVNLMDCCAVAVPAGFRRDGIPFGVSLIAPAFADRDLAVLGGRLHRAAECGSGLFPGARFDAPARTDADRIALFVVGAHLSGMPLNRELVELGAQFEAAVRTSNAYRLFALPNTQPKKPGLVQAPQACGGGIEGEVWTLSPEAFGLFVSRIPPPLGVGKIELSDGRRVSGFLCEAFAVADAQDITSLGGWRRYCTEAARSAGTGLELPAAGAAS
jgi:allophanate hydrolase